MSSKTLYRASDDCYCDSVGTTCFAARREDAEEYLANPGFGGVGLYRVVVQFASEHVLDLRDGAPLWFRRIVEDHVGAKESWVVTASPKAYSEFVRRGIRWVVFVDDFPEDCETWCLIGETSGVDDVEDAMEQIG